jgi:metallo-beta-lactamase class B
MIARALIAAIGLLSAAPAAAQAKGPASMAEHRASCAGKTDWSDPAPPLRIFGNVYDIGTCTITVLLVTGPKGHIVIDAATAEAVPSILANIRRLGLRPMDVRLLLSSHEHVDHAGGLAALRRATGASLLATAAARPLLASGKPALDDPQRTILPPAPAVPVERTVRDGEVVALGPLRLIAHTTPGHSPGGTSWSWRSCDGATCRDIVYADSLSAVSADGYRFTDHPTYVTRLRAAIAKVGGLKCDLLVTPHPSASQLYERLEGAMPLSDPAQCTAYAALARANLEKRLADEAKAGS